MIKMHACMFTVSALAYNNQYGGYEQQPGETTNKQSPPPQPMCRTVTEACIGYGDYNCCDGLYCVPWHEYLPPGLGVCLPLLGEIPKQPPPKDKCQKPFQACQLYGQYSCCPDFQCMHTGRLPGGAGVRL